MDLDQNEQQEQQQPDEDSNNEAKYLYDDREWSKDQLWELKDKVEEDYPGGCHVYTGGTVENGDVPKDIVTTIIHPDTPVIAADAFLKIKSLKRVIFHNEVTDIGRLAFFHTGLEGEVVIPPKVTRIMDVLFGGCDNLRSVILHDKVTGFKWVPFPKGVTPFTPPKLNLENYKDVIQTDSDKFAVRIFYNSMFPRRALFCDGNGSLTTFCYSKANDGDNYNLDALKDALKGHFPGPCHIYQNGHIVAEDGTVVPRAEDNDIATVIIHPDTPIIQAAAFEGIEKLRRVIFHNNITKIGDMAFERSGIEGTVFMPPKATDIRKRTFFGTQYLRRVILHDDITDIGDSAFCTSWILKFVEKHEISSVKKGKKSNSENEGEYSSMEISHPQTNVIKTSDNVDNESESRQPRISYADVVRKKLGRKMSAVTKTAVGAKRPTVVNNTALKQ